MSAITSDSTPPSFESPMNNLTKWTELPTELLMKIFSQLKLDEETELEEIEDDLDARDSLLNIRLVHPRWKLVMDELLEKWCLEYWTKWNTDEGIFIEHHYDFPKLTFADKTEDGKWIEDSGNGFGIEDILWPNFLLEENIPSSTKHLHIGDIVNGVSGNQSQKKKMVRKDFSKYGHQLTSLSIRIIFFNSNPLSLETLARILHLTPNLKAVALESVDIKREERAAAEQINLPSLPHLEHVRLWRVNDEVFTGPTQDYPPSQFTNISWLMKPYKTQLVSLQTDESFEWDRNDDGLLVYPNLKRLKLWPPSTEVLKAEVVLPSLQCLSLGELRLERKGPTTLQLVQKFISQFSSTLIELHLGILQMRHLGPRTYAKKKRNKAADVAFGSPFTNFTFPLLKSFAILYPKCEKEVAVVKDFLKMFPALETLKFLPTSDEEISQEIARKRIMDLQFWRICSMLKKIQVQIVGRPEEMILTMRAPFS